jgi:hypothetical protein
MAARLDDELVGTRRRRTDPVRRIPEKARTLVVLTAQRPTGRPNGHRVRVRVGVELPAINVELERLGVFSRRGQRPPPRICPRASAQRQPRAGAAPSDRRRFHRFRSFVASFFVLRTRFVVPSRTLNKITAARAHRPRSLRRNTAAGASYTHRDPWVLAAIRPNPRCGS